MSISKAHVFPDMPRATQSNSICKTRHYLSWMLLRAQCQTVIPTNSIVRGPYATVYRGLILIYIDVLCICPDVNGSVQTDAEWIGPDCEQIRSDCGWIGADYRQIAPDCGWIGQDCGRKLPNNPYCEVADVFMGRTIRQGACHASVSLWDQDN